MDTMNQEMKKHLSGILLDWYDCCGRTLPWREDPSPYHVWISEIMLQQTRVEAVKDYYVRFLEALPTVEALADADEDLCAKLWQGLGYYSRVRNLHKAAVQITEEYDGVIPDTSAGLRKLAGIGPYTAAAIASICFDERIPALDGNLLRVFSRMTGFDQDIKSNAARSAAQKFYDEIFPLKRCGDFNQALMDLGASVCLPNGVPQCEKCPWKEYCRSYADGTCQQLPVVLPKAKREVENKTVFLIYYKGRLALRRRPDHGLLAGLYEYPNTGGTLQAEDIPSYLETLGFSEVSIRPLPEAKHIFTHKEWHMTGWEILADRRDDHMPDTSADRELLLVTADELRDLYSVPSAFSKYTAQIHTDYLR